MALGPGRGGGGLNRLIRHQTRRGLPTGTVGPTPTAPTRSPSTGRIPQAVVNLAGSAAASGVASSASPRSTPSSGPSPAEIQQLVHLVPPSFAPYLPTVLQAANKYDIPASVLLAQIHQESNFDPSAASSAGAQGVSQFIPETAKAYGVQYGTSKRAVTSQIDGQAKYMADLVKQTGSLSSALTAYSGGYASSDYAQPILAAAKNYSAADKLTRQGASLGGPYTTPFQKASYTQSRTDEGVDYTGQGQINAIGRARYLGQGQAWGPSAGGGGSGYGVLYELLKGPKAGKDVFTYEGISPAGPSLSPGDVIRKGQPIASFAPGGSIETGWANPTGAPLAQPSYSEGDVTAQGTRFQQFLSGLGAASRPGQTPLSGGVSPSAARQGALVSQTTGLPAASAQTAVQSAKSQRRAQAPPLVQLTPPNAAGPAMPQALAALFGGALPALPPGSLPQNLSTTDLATLLAQVAARRTPTTSPFSSLRRRR